jgi:flavin reductase (DIM6/NTAB) family NADH-FMN oxidoreductase RutF
VPLDLGAANWHLGGLRPFPAAVTTTSGGKVNGCIALSPGSGSIVPEAPRVTVGLTTTNLTHDMVRESGVFAVHLLGADDDAIDASLAIIRGLASSSGRDGDKLSGFATREGATGSPILLDALGYVEGQVVDALVTEENTIFVADVVAAERLRGGRRLAIGEAWGKLPPEWVEAYERAHLEQEDAARRARGLPVPERA